MLTGLLRYGRSIVDERRLDVRVVVDNPHFLIPLCSILVIIALLNIDP